MAPLFALAATIVSLHIPGDEPIHVPTFNQAKSKLSPQRRLVIVGVEVGGMKPGNEKVFGALLQQRGRCRCALERARPAKLFPNKLHCQMRLRANAKLKGMCSEFSSMNQFLELCSCTKTAELLDTTFAG